MDKNKYISLPKRDIEEFFLKACKLNDLETVRFLLTSDELTNKANMLCRNELGFKLACRSGSVNMVRYLLTSKELEVHADIHKDNDEGFCIACEEGHLELIEYLCESKELIRHANIGANNFRGLINACLLGKTEVVKYLINHDFLLNNIEREDIIKKCFAGAVEKCHMDIIKFLILEVNIEKPTDMVEFVNSNKVYQKIQDLFKLRDEYFKMDKNLPFNNTKNRLKI